MNKNEINEVKQQLWDHLQNLNGRIEELRRDGYVVYSEQIIDRLGVRRKGHFLLDQYFFCTSEIKYWKELTS